MQPISNQPSMYIFPCTPNAQAQNGSDSPIEESANSAGVLGESGGNCTAESTDSPPLTNFRSETRGSSGITMGIMSSAEIPANPDALITMNSEDFRQKLNSGTLPDGPILVTGDLVLTDNDALANLPAGLTVRGRLFLGGCTSLTSLPEGLTVREGLCLVDCTSLRSLPAGLTVGERLSLEGCTSLTLLPAGLTVDGHLELNRCRSLTSLPAGLTVGGSLIISNCESLTSLPEGLTVRGRLALRGCRSLTSLSEGLTVRGDLILEDCTSLTSLPAGLTVGGKLDLSFCRSLTSLPNWITELGPRGDGRVREVDLTGTGLSDALIDRLRNLQLPPLGMRFIFRQAAAVEGLFFSTHLF